MNHYTLVVVEPKGIQLEGSEVESAIAYIKAGEEYADEWKVSDDTWQFPHAHVIVRVRKVEGPDKEN